MDGRVKPGHDVVGEPQLEGLKPGTLPFLVHVGGAEIGAVGGPSRAIVAANSGNSRDMGEEEIRWRMTS